MTLRTLLVKLGFKGDIGKLTEFDNRIKGLTKNVVGLTAVFGTLTAGIGYFLNEAAKLEQTKIAFEVMAGSVEMGQRLIKDLFMFARTTPFQIPGVMQASKILLAMGVTAEEQIDTLEKIGHVAAGIGKPLDQLASIFGRVKAAGYLTGYEMERLRRAGVPLGAYLSEMLKKPEKDILRMIRRKEISYEMFADGWELMVEKRFPKLMDKLLTTFKGITSNLKDYIYEIVAFSGEELLPIAKLIATQLQVLLDSSRGLIALRFKQFFGTVSNGLSLLNKLFVRMYYRTKEVTGQLGGFTRLFKIFATIFGTMLGVKSLAILGRLGKMTMTFLSPMALKLALIGAAMIGILAVTEDLFGFLSGKESLTGRILDDLENRFPTAFSHIQHWLKILKGEIEGFSLLLVGVFEGLSTGNWDMAKAGLNQISDTYRKIVGGVKKEETPEFDPFRDPDISRMNFVEGTIAQSQFLKDVAKGLEGFKSMVDVSPQGKATIEPSFIRGGNDYTGMIKDYFTKSPIEKIQSRAAKLKGFANQDDAKININTNVNINKLPVNASAKEVVERIKNEVIPLVKRTVGDTYKNNSSFVEPEQY